MRACVLLAENNLEHRELCYNSLKKSGYEVRVATNPEETCAYLDQGGIDVAIIDVRLRNDDNADDHSGVEIALDPRYKHIAKIIYTGFDVENANANELLGVRLDELPAATRIVSKPKGFAELAAAVKDLMPDELNTAQTIPMQPLLDAVAQTLAVWPRLRRTHSQISDQIRQDHKWVRIQAYTAFWLALLVTLAGAVAVFIGVMLTYRGTLLYGVTVAIAGVLETLTGVWFGRLAEEDKRLDNYHQELMGIDNLQVLLSSAEILPSERQTALQEFVLQTVATRWFAPSPAGKDATKA